jgi:hypothetical protein
MRTLASMSVAVAVALLSVPAAAQSLSADNRTELALRALLAIAGAPIKPEAQHCNLGELYARSHSATAGVTVGEALLGELATMGSGRNTVRGACRGSERPHCTVALHHARGEDLSSTEFRFDVIDGKARIETLICLSTP